MLKMLDDNFKLGEQLKETVDKVHALEMQVLQVKEQSSQEI